MTACTLPSTTGSRGIAPGERRSRSRSRRERRVELFKQYGVKRNGANHADKVSFSKGHLYLNPAFLQGHICSDPG